VEIRTYRVTMQHDKGRRKIDIVADDIVSAIQRVCKIEGAPLRSAIGAKLVLVKKVV